MARLETQINQIYLTDPSSKKTSVILYDEEINASCRLFILAELSDLKKKTEAGDLKKISEIILESFRSNKKLPAEDLFESSLAQINQNLADLAHDGNKSWVGKFSCLICLKCGDNIYLANDGNAGSWLLRKGQLLEVLGPEKRGTHPLKTFTNFTQGKLAANDSLIIASANIFNYVSLEHFANILTAKNLERACEEISAILRDSINENQSFAGFFLGFVKPTPASAAAISSPVPSVPIYAPLPEEIVPTTEPWKLPMLKLPAVNLAKLSLPKISWPIKLPSFTIPTINLNLRGFKWVFFNNLTRAGKFFFISFVLFLIIFLINLSSYFVNRNHKKTAQRVDALVLQINQQMTDAQSAVIYKNNDQALTIINEAQKNFETLSGLDSAKSLALQSRLENIRTQINKVSTVAEPQVVVELRHDPVYLGKAPTAFLFSSSDSNSLSRYDTTLKDFFLLNSAKAGVTGVAFMPQVGVTVASGNAIYKIDEKLQQLEAIASFNNGSISLLRSWGNNLLALDKSNGKIMKVALSKGAVAATSVAAVADADKIRDIGGDGDLWTLSSDKLTKISGGKPADITLPNVTDGINNANKLFVGSNIYILEASKRRVVIVNKTGVLQNQIYFPTLDNLRDFYVDEAKRSIYLLDDGKLYKITF